MGNNPGQAKSSLSFLKGSAALEREEYKLAEVGFAQALHEDPGNARAMIFLMYAQLKRRPSLRLVDGLQAALRLAPQDTLVLRTAAKVHVLLDQAPKGMALLERARSIAPQEADTHAELAAGYLALRKRAECEAALKEALRLAPESELALHVKSAFAKVYFDAATRQRAAEQTLRKSPESAMSHTLEGKSAMAKGEVVKGYWHLREAVRLNPKSVEANVALVAALRQRFPLYDWFYRFSLHAIRWRVVTSFVLVYAIVRLVVLATSDATLPMWASPVSLALVTVLAGIAAMLLWPMPIINFALRFHPIGRR